MDQLNTTDMESREFFRLYWQCRRGMLELDILLQRFMDARFHSLGPEQRQALERLLTSSDQLLLEYLMGRTIPIDKEVADIVQQIRTAPDRFS